MKKTFLLICLLIVSWLAFAKQPNIIIFFVDDMGWQDCSLPFHDQRTKWNEIYHTPNLEKLAAQGMRFTHAYAAPVCSPSRVSLMTGMNAIRHKVTNWTLWKNQSTDGKSDRLAPPAWNLNGISPVPGVENTVYATTLAQVLQQNNYRTIHVGKAHLGAAGTLGSDPRNLGFDVNIAGHAAGAPQSYYGLDDFGKKKGRDSIWKVPGLEKYWGKDIFLTEALTLEAIAAMEQSRQAQKPFFLHLSHYAIHTPIMGDPRFMRKYQQLGLDSTEAKYASLIEGMDKSLGDVMQYLQQNQLSENTIILFLSDNGGLSATARGGIKHQHNTPLRSGKGSAYEGGIRIPFVLKWPGMTSPNSICAENIIIEDVFPTVLRMAGLKKAQTVQKIDGQDISPLIRHTKTAAKRLLYWHYPHIWGPKGPALELYSVVRQGDWKLIYFHADQHFELYNTTTDLAESQNVFTAQHPMALKLAKALGKALKSGQCEMPKMIATQSNILFPDDQIKTLSQ